MPGEQIIYLDPNDELTRVRERIEEVPARRIIMVVPQQTQLRSNVGWRLLHARARELGKEIQVISPDRQVRAVAKAAGFRVSQPQEGSSASKTRTSMQPPQRGGTERRGTQRQRGPINRGPVDNRNTRQREPLSPPAPREEQPPDLPEFQPPQSTWLQQAHPPTHPEEPTSRQGNQEAYEIIEDDAFDQPYEFRIDEAQAPSARPLVARHDEEEQEDPYIPDYDTARRIREAARGESGGESHPPLHEQEPSDADAIDRVPTSHFSTPPEVPHSHPFEDDIEEFSPSFLPEQHGPTFAPDVDEIAPDVTDIPTDVHKIEYLDDRDETGASQEFPARQWDNAFFNGPEVDESALPPPSDTRVRGSRSGKLQRRPADEDDEDFLPPADQPTFIRSNKSLTPGSASRAGNRGAPVPQPPVEPQPATRNVNTRPIPQQSQSRPITRSRIPAAPPPPRRQRNRASRRRGVRVTTIVIVALLLLLLVGIGFLYYGTTAAVAITVPSKVVNLSSIKLVASTKTQSKFPNSVASQLLTYNASVSGAGTATGTTRQGNSKATGTVIFTNNGQQNVTIPTGTVLSTNAGTGSVQFVTTASPIVPPTNANNSPVPVPVEAQNVGNNGNVAANTIKVIPDVSITAIAAASGITSQQINLSVTNPDALSGGGAAQVATVTQNDLQSLKNSLHAQLQTQFKNWLLGQLHQEDIAGTPFPDIVDSAQPLPEEQLTQVPTVGSPLASKAFTGVLSAKINVLVVRKSSLVAAAQAQLNADALATKPRPYTVATPASVTLTNEHKDASKDGTTINITLSASGQAVLQVNTQQLSMYLSGKTKDQAQSAISSGDAGLAGVENVNIVISPSFLGLMPFRSEHIHITVIPGTALPKG